VGTRARVAGLFAPPQRKRPGGLDLHLLGDIAGRRQPGALDDTERFYRDAMAIAEPLGMRPAVAHCLLGLGELYVRTGRGEVAQEHLHTAAGLFRDLGIAPLQARAERQVGTPRG
jgi:hypothetical protein